MELKQFLEHLRNSARADNAENVLAEQQIKVLPTNATELQELFDCIADVRALEEAAAEFQEEQNVKAAGSIRAGR